jgi:ABC-2 type transport system permease protein
MTSLAILAAFLRRDWTIDLSYRASFALQLLSTLFLLALFFYLSRVIDAAEFSSQTHVSGGYFAYAAVGLGLLEIVPAGLGSFARKLRDEQTTGTFETLMATPQSPSMIILASAAYDLLRATVDGMVLILAAVVIFGLDLNMNAASAALAVVTLVGSVGLFASLGVAVAALTVLYQRTTGLLGLVATGLALLGGVYFPIGVMPEPIESVAEVLPFTWALDVLRASLLGGDVDSAQLFGLWASVVVLLPLALLGFKASIRHARRAGTLAQY